MNHQSRRGRSAAAAAAALLSCLLLSACGAADADSAGEKPAGGEAACAPYAAYRGHEGTTVRLLMNGGIDSVKLMQAMRRFSDCTSIRFVAESNPALEDEIRKQAGTEEAPDLAIVPQPGLIADLARNGDLKPAAPAAVKTAGENWSADWLEYGSVDGTFYAVPFDSSVKSFVWYSPSSLKKQGYEVPQTWDELISISDRISASGRTPWCAGIESGGATGWPATDWLEDLMLRVQGPDVYDQWVSHAIPFDDPKVVKAADRVASILKNGEYVRGGVGSVATTSFGDGGLPILEDGCAFYRMASFYAGNWPRGTKVAPDGDVFAFYLPAVDPSKGKPVLAAGSFIAAFKDRPEIAAVHSYLASADFAAKRVALGGWLSANNKVDPESYTSEVDKLSAEILNDSGAVVRFDGSDLMPASVGAGSFWTGMTDWINGGDTRAVLSAIEKSWP